MCELGRSGTVSECVHRIGDSVSVGRVSESGYCIRACPLAPSPLSKGVQGTVTDLLRQGFLSVRFGGVSCVRFGGVSSVPV